VPINAELCGHFFDEIPEPNEQLKYSGDKDDFWTGLIDNDII